MIQTPGAEDFVVDGLSSQAWVKHHEDVARMASGALPGKNGLAQGSVGVDGKDSTERAIRWTTGGVLRWDLTAKNNAESIPSGGSDLALRRYDNTGALIDAPLIVGRAEGQVQVTVLSISSVFRHNGTLGFFGANPVTQQSVSGSSTAAQVTSIIALLRNYGLSA